MTEQQRDQILKLARKLYDIQGCRFPEDDQEMVEYLFNSMHPAEQRCIQIAIEAHNIYNDDDDLDDSEFFEWHGL